MRLRRIAVLSTALLISLDLFSHRTSAQNTPPPLSATTPNATTPATCLQIDVSSTPTPDKICSALTQETAANNSPTFSYRVGNDPWQSAGSSGNKVKIDNLTSKNHLVLFGSRVCPALQSDSPVQCSLIVQVPTSDSTTPTVPSGWHELLHWVYDKDQKNGHFIIDDLDDFYEANPGVRVVINGRTVIGEVNPSQTLEDKKLEQKRKWAGRILDPATDLAVEVYSVPEGCRDFLPDSRKARRDIMNIPAILPHDLGPANGITLGGPKIFDTFALKQKLAATAAQLAAISPFNQAQITAQYGSFQGVTRDTSYLAAQLTTSPTPSIVNTTAAATGNTVTTANAPVAGIGTVTTTCPPGYVPGYVAAGVATCTAATGSSTSQPLTVTTTNGNPTTPETVVTANQPTTQIQTATPSLQGTVPTAPTLNPLTPPTNVGVSASDMLDEQTRLSSQVATLQMLLQGASSDQLLLSHQRAYGVRAQTTIGFPISVETPAKFHGAVAEVRILVLPYPSAGTSQPISIVNLLPSQKTYNVAKVTSNSKAFGAGVAIQPISFGLTTGKSKDRMYLAKDTDTVALQYPPAGHIPASDFSDYSDCDDLPPGARSGEAPDYTKYDFDSAVMFGWQFRPVLGAAAVAAGVRTSFAQLALPQSDALAFSPEVWVQTRWRHYDQKKQLADQVYPESCHWQKLNDPVSVINPVVVKDVQVADEGQGLLRFHAVGDLFSSTGQVRSGSLNVAPTYFDGYSIEYFEHAGDVLANGDLQLLDEALHEYSLVIPTKASISCRIEHPKLSAFPMPDGNSLMQLEYDRPNYQSDPDKDGPQHPLLLIGADLYGLRDKPLKAMDPQDPQILLDPDSACKAVTGTRTHCAFTFVAPTDSIRSARNFLLRDPAWDSSGITAPIAIDPAFTKIEAESKPAKNDDDGDDDAIRGCPDKTSCEKKREQKKEKDRKADLKAKTPTWFLLSGTNFSALKNADIVEPPPPVNPEPADSPTPHSRPTKSKPKQKPTGVAAKDTEPPEPPPLDLLSSCASKDGCLQIISDSSDGTPSTVDPKYIHFAGDTSLWVALVKPVGVHIFWSRKGLPPFQWDLAIKKDDAATITADPAVLYETDSRAVTFTGADFSKVTAVIFEKENLALPVPATKAKLVVQVTSAVTAKFGHKELLAQTLDDKGKPKTIPLPIEVVRH